MTIDRSILRCCCNIDLSIDSGPTTEPSGHLQFLPREYLSCYYQPIHQLEFLPFFATPVLTAKPCYLGQCPLVLELGH
jgi:hypothetical protein